MCLSIYLLHFTIFHEDPLFVISQVTHKTQSGAQTDSISPIREKKLWQMCPGLQYIIMRQRAPWTCWKLLITSTWFSQVDRYGKIEAELCKRPRGPWPGSAAPRSERSPSAADSALTLASGRDPAHGRGSSPKLVSLQVDSSSPAGAALSPPWLLPAPLQLPVCVHWALPSHLHSAGEAKLNSCADQLLSCNRAPEYLLTFSRIRFSSTLSLAKPSLSDAILARESLRAASWFCSLVRANSCAALWDSICWEHHKHQNSLNLKSDSKSKDQYATILVQYHVTKTEFICGCFHIWLVWGSCSITESTLL